MSGRFLTRVALALLAATTFVLATGQRALLCAEDAAAAQPSISTEGSFPQETLSDSAGGERSLSKARGKAATVLVSMSVECPISSEFVSTLNRLAERFGPRGVNLIALEPDAGQTLDRMADYARQHKLAFPFLQDAGGKVSRRLQFKVTPEVCVFDAAGKVAYCGRIDDRYRGRSAATGESVSADLEKALEEIMAGKPVTNARTKAVGCPIQFSTAPARGASPTNSPGKANPEPR